MTLLADQIRRARGSESQQAFSTRLGACIASLQRWEAGGSRPQQYGHIMALADAGVSIDALTRDAQ